LSAIEANKKHICFALSDVVKDEYIYLLYTFVRRECFKFIRREKLFLKLVELTVSSNVQTRKHSMRRISVYFASVFPTRQI